MSKKIFAVLIVTVVAIFAGYNIYQSQRAEITMSDLAMANVEALASSSENDPDYNPDCPNGCLSDGDGCHCYHNYSDYREKKWK